MLKIQIILGSTRQNRFGDKPARWIYKEAKKRKEIETEFLDLRDYPLEFYDEPVPPTMLNGNYSDEMAKRWVKKVGEADAYIIVAPEYNHGYPAVLKNALDYPYSEWNNKPVGFISYGGVGGARSIQQLRQVAIQLQMAPIRNSIHIPSFWKMLDENGKLKPGAFNSLKESADGFFDQLIWWAKALKKARGKA